MIKSSHLKDCELQVREAINELFELIKRREFNINDFIILLADGMYKPNLANNVNHLNPYLIDSRSGDYRDMHRREFYVTYINQNRETFYKGLSEDAKGEFFRYCTSLEFMIYTHIWESNWFLKTLKQLSNLASGKKYDWHIENSIPSFDRRKFITEEIRSVFEKDKLKIVDIMKSYHSQIRNAFAHSDYDFSYSNKEDKIHFLNYSGQNWELKSITYEQWHKRFALTLSLSHYVLEKIETERKALKDGIYEISHPSTKFPDKLQRVKILYNSQHNSFSFA